MDTEDTEAQSDEMTALSSILDPDTFSCNSPCPDKAQDLVSGSIKISMELPETFFICPNKDNRKQSLGDNASSSSSGGTDSRIQISYLPPLTLHFTLPKDYPSGTGAGAKPIFVLSSTWCQRKPLSKLCKKLDHLWKTEGNGSAILYTWYSFLRHDALAWLGIKDTLKIRDFNPHHHHSTIQQTKKPKGSTNMKNGVGANVNVKRRPCKAHDDPRAVFEPCSDSGQSSSNLMIPYLVQFNIDESARVFNASVHKCPICFTERFGKDSIKFHGCGHVFCRDCVGEYFKSLIVDGAVDSLKCLEHGCNFVPGPDIVKISVDSVLYERYDRLLLSRTLDQMDDILYCPISSCHSPVLAEPDETDKLAKCPKCFYVFCSNCKKGYHGVEPCRFKDAEKKAVYDSYASGSELEKKAMEKVYGKRQLESLVHTVLSEKWISDQSRPCPHCSVPIEKFAGCNKVTCFKCNTYFCWICLVQLDHGNPYKHFNDPASKCYNNLFFDPNHVPGEGENGGQDLERGDFDEFDEDDDDYDEEIWDPADADDWYSEEEDSD